MTKSTFQRVSGSRGVWNGVIEGRGNIGLRLLIFRNGQLKSSRYMGKVKLERTNSTIFTFNTPIPADDNWSWSVVTES